MNSVAIGLLVGLILALIFGLVCGYFIAMKVFKKQIKKNPPITEAQIRMMYAQMGRKPTETQIKQIMRTFKNQNI